MFLALIFAAKMGGGGGGGGGGLKPPLCLHPCTRLATTLPSFLHSFSHWVDIIMRGPGM